MGEQLLTGATLSRRDVLIAAATGLMGVAVGSQVTQGAPYQYGLPAERTAAQLPQANQALAAPAQQESPETPADAAKKSAETRKLHAEAEQIEAATEQTRANGDLARQKQVIDNAKLQNDIDRDKSLVGQVERFKPLLAFLGAVATGGWAWLKDRRDARRAAVAGEQAATAKLIEERKTEFTTARKTLLSTPDAAKWGDADTTLVALAPLGGELSRSVLNTATTILQRRPAAPAGPPHPAYNNVVDAFFESADRVRNAELTRRQEQVEAGRARASRRGAETAVLNEADAQLLYTPVVTARNLRLAEATMLTGRDWSNLDLDGLRAPRATLDLSVFAGANLGRSDFTGAQMRGVTFDRITGVRVDVRRADLAGARIINTDLAIFVGLLDADRLDGVFIDGTRIGDRELTAEEIARLQARGALVVAGTDYPKSGRTSPGDEQ